MTNPVDDKRLMESLKAVKRRHIVQADRDQGLPPPPGALISTFEMLDGVINRAIDIGYGAQVYWRGRFPMALFTWGIPFAFERIDLYDYLWHEAG